MPTCRPQAPLLETHSGQWSGSQKGPSSYVSSYVSDTLRGTGGSCTSASGRGGGAVHCFISRKSADPTGRSWS